jgi:HAD superfamily hydrolase (TIGR01509 family)
MIDGALLDVGGTLWPNRWPATDGDDDERAARLIALSPSVDPVRARKLAVLLDRSSAPPDGGPQHADESVRQAIAELGLGSLFPDPTAVRRAVCLPADGHLHMLEGAAALLRRLHEEGVRCVIISNTLWRDGPTYLADFAALGLGDCLAGAVTSIDTGYRKPHPAIFAAALDIVGHPAGRCVMIGDSEECDIAPARQLGLSTIRVTPEQTSPRHPGHHSSADLWTDSLASVAPFLLD